jgi:hypothetical protein
MTTLASPDTQLAAALRRARRRGVTKAELCRHLGIREMDLDAYADGTRAPAAWIAREIATTVGRSAAELFPRLAEQRASQPCTRGGVVSTQPATGTPPCRGQFPPPELKKVAGWRLIRGGRIGGRRCAGGSSAARRCARSAAGCLITRRRRGRGGRRAWITSCRWRGAAGRSIPGTCAWCTLAAIRAVAWVLVRGARGWAGGLVGSSSRSP